MLLTVVKTARRLKPSPEIKIDREAVSRYLLSLAAARIDYVSLSGPEEAFVSAVMQLPFADLMEKHLFCRDLGLLLRDRRFPVVWNAQHLRLLLKIHRAELPDNGLVWLRIYAEMENGTAPGVFSLLCELVGALDTIPTTSVQWLEVLRMLHRNMDRAGIIEFINGGYLFRMKAAALQRLGRLRQDQVQPWCEIASAYEKASPALLDLFFYFVSRLGFADSRRENTIHLVCRFVQEALPRAEARVRPYECTYLMSGDRATVQQAQHRAFTLFAFWLQHRGASVDFLTADLDVRLPVSRPAAEFRRLDFSKVIDYLPVQCLWNLPALYKHRLRLLLHLGSGKNIRRFPGLRMPVSKRVAHVFHHLPPEEYWSASIVNASLRDAWWATLGGEERLRHALPPFQWIKGRRFAYRPYRNLHRQFPAWEKVLKRLVYLSKKDPAGPALSIQDVRKVIAYFHYLINEDLPLNLKGSTLRSLLRRFEDWRQEQRLQYLTKANDNGPVAESWTGAPYRELEMEVEGARYRIVQVKTLAALFKEADALRHCVWRYHPKAVKGTCSIWSLRKCEGEKITRLVTIEVSKSRRIVQARGKLNANPDPLYHGLIERWATQENLVCRFIPG